MVEIKYKKLVENALVPAQMNPGDAGWDVRAVNRIILSPYNIIKVRTGIAVEIPHGYEIQIRGKSGPAIEKGFVIAQGIGTIDSGYRGEVYIILKNGRPYTTVIESGEMLAQFVVKEIPEVTWKEVKTLNESVRGTDGLGEASKKAMEKERLKKTIEPEIKEEIKTKE